MPRLNKQSVVFTSRDHDGLLFVAQQKFVRLDTLGERYAPGYAPAVISTTPREPLKHGGIRTGLAWPSDPRLRIMATQKIVHRWVKMGVADLWQPWADQPAWVRVTQRGLDALGLDLDDQGKPYWTEIPWPDNVRLRDDGEKKGISKDGQDKRLSHYHRINQVRMALARGAVSDIPTRHTWHSEREVEALLPQRSKGTRLPHKTDGYVELNTQWAWEYPRKNGEIEQVTFPIGSRIGIEVELSRKRFAAYEEFILPDLLKLYHATIYFAYGNAYNAVVTARRDRVSTNEDRKRIRIIELQ